jgi:hypothetical protein
MASISQLEVYCKMATPLGVLPAFPVPTRPAQDGAKYLVEINPLESVPEDRESDSRLHSRETHQEEVPIDSICCKRPVMALATEDAVPGNGVQSHSMCALKFKAFNDREGNKC